MIISRPTSKSESDLLFKHEHLPLIITDLSKEEIKTISAPEGGWTHDKLEAIDYYQLAPYGWEAFLGNTEHWIGGSEV
jgi:hypothetical protein